MFGGCYFSAKEGVAEEMDVIFEILIYENLGVAVITNFTTPFVFEQLDLKHPIGEMDPLWAWGGPGG